MTTLLHYDVAVRDPFMRHEIAEAASDPAIFIEHDGKRIVVAGIFEKDAFERREDIVDEFWSFQELGADELAKDPDRQRDTIAPELVLRALKRAGADKVVVPPSFGVAVANYLGDNGVELVIDGETWWERRRRKSPWELEGIERAQRAAENAMLAATRMLMDAEPTRDGQLRFEGEILTAELVRDAMQQELLLQRCECSDLIVQSGPTGMRGHDPGTGPILPNETCIVDVWPRDMRSGVHSDMTRTFVPGTPSDEVKRIHADVKTALEIGLDAARPGATDVFERVSDFFHEKGYPTQLHHKGGEPLKEGFNHGLGHGVCLDVHERPSLGRRSDALVEGDVLTIEPGLYFNGIGGVRLEDTVVITAGGPEHFTDPMSYDLTPWGVIENLEFDERGLVPAIVQDADSGEVLMLAYADEEAVKRTLDSGTTWFWSRSRKEYWNKGATSGNTQEVVEVRYDCDGDALLYVVNAKGPACHTGERSCFYRTLDSPSPSAPSSSR